MDNESKKLAEWFEQVSNEKRIEVIERDVKNILISHLNKTNLCHYIVKELLKLGYYKLNDGAIVFENGIKYNKYEQAKFNILLNANRNNTIKEIINKVEDMIGGKMIAQALREIYLEEDG